MGTSQAYKVYREVQPGAKYVMAVDPAGYGHDHAAFQVLEVWRDRIYKPRSSPAPTSRRVVHGQDCRVTGVWQALIGVERSGVGLAVWPLRSAR